MKEYVIFNHPSEEQWDRDAYRARRFAEIRRAAELARQIDEIGPVGIGMTGSAVRSLVRIAIGSTKA